MQRLKKIYNSVLRPKQDAPKSPVAHFGYFRVVVTSATLIVTGALLVVTKGYYFNSHSFLLLVVRHLLLLARHLLLVVTSLDMLRARRPSSTPKIRRVTP